MKQLSSLWGAKQFPQQRHTGTITWLKEGGVRTTLPDVFLQDPSEHTKTLSYVRLADIEQGEKETPGKFLDRLWEALYKFTDIDLKIKEGEMTL